MKNRIDQKLEALKKENKKAMVTYLTAGYPDMAKTKELLFAQQQAGVDLCELGIPFSDPVADGPVIQQASYQSILAGTTLQAVFDLMKKMRADGLQVPVIFMMYYNTVFHYGLLKFAEACAEAGVDGVIIPDLPLEEQGPLAQACRQVQQAPYLIQLISPVSMKRLPRILANAQGFVYCISHMGVTGKQADFHHHVRQYLQEVKSQSPVPVLVGFGIRAASDVMPVRDVLDGAIIGSDFIHTLEQNQFSAQAAETYIRRFQTEWNG